MLSNHFAPIPILSGQVRKTTTTDTVLFMTLRGCLVYKWVSFICVYVCESFTYIGVYGFVFVPLHFYVDAYLHALLQ